MKPSWKCLMGALCLTLCHQIGAAPLLPSGLDPLPQTPALQHGPDSKQTVPGLSNQPKAPRLPSGLASPPKQDSKKNGRLVEPAPFSLGGFWEIRGGLRTQRDRHEPGLSIAETRLHLELEKAFDYFSLNLTTDLLYDGNARSRRINLDRGSGWVDLREANIAFTPASFLDIKIGRQILTWGTGDLLFINDLFPKDFPAFFIGRDDEYLKAPSDAVKASFFTRLLNLDLVYALRFDPDRFISGERISFFNASFGEITGRNAVIQTDQPDSGEWALRLYRTLGRTEFALYGYRGFWKSPAGFDAAADRATFPRLRTIGASVRRPFLRGVGNLEIGYYDSPDSDNGKNPLVRNSEFRLLTGFEREIVSNLTFAGQYYLEFMLDHAQHVQNRPRDTPIRNRYRHVLTTRLTWLTVNQNLIWSAFAFYSPSDQDAYLRPNVRYKVSDQWTVELGGNFFLGEKRHTFFSQFKQNNNVYAAVRFGF